MRQRPPPVVNIPLSYPVTHNETTYTSLTLRKPENCLLATFPRGPYSSERYLRCIAMLASAPIAVIENLDATDWFAIRARPDIRFLLKR